MLLYKKTLQCCLRSSLWEFLSLGLLKNQLGDQRKGGDFVASWEPSTCNNPSGSGTPWPLFSFVKDSYGTRICQRSPLASAPFAGALGAEQYHIQSGATAQAVYLLNPALTPLFSCIHIFFKDFICSFPERSEERKKERERNISVWLPLLCFPLATWPTTQACALTRN